MSYARARLFLGASAVGTLSLLAGVMLVAGLPHRLFPTAPLSWPADVGWLALVAVVHAAVLAPFDLFGGLLIPREYGRTREGVAAFARRWLRGATVYGATATLFGVAVLLASRTAGGGGTIAVVVFGSLALLAAQPAVAMAVGGGRIARPAATDPARALGARTLVLTSPHPHVTGGAYGLPGRTAWVVASRWTEGQGRVAWAEQVVRRRWLERSGARDRGVWLALVWNLVPVLVTLALFGAPVAVADVLRLALASTLWSFLGVLTLPTPSRRAVHAADGAAVAAGADRAALVAGLRELDRDQDDEPVRARGVETIFHPIPAAEHRVAALALAGEPGPVTLEAWHAARTALYLSVATLGLLGRAVHCNLGRPEAWVFLPSD
jgi:hypothetical protein